MLLGILSDTHNRADAMRVAVETLQQARAEFFIHCGDVGDERVIDQLAGLPNAVVWGNNDYDRPRLARYAQGIGVNIHDPYASLELHGRRIVVTHGDDPRLLRRIIDESAADYLLYGHTHVPGDETLGSVRLINPGALHRASPKTVATLDLSSGRLQHLVVHVR